ncbi:hypothetical protein JCM3765_002312 [Sporobolomyces pararoseus]
MTSVTAIGSGLTVRATGLITAAEAWPSLKQTFKFFDLLLLRKRNGTLRAIEEDEGRQSSVGKIPVEVWEVIRAWRTRIELEDVEHEMLSKYFERCDEEWECECHDVRKVTWRLLKEGLADCKWFRFYYENDQFEQFWNGFNPGVPSGFAEVFEPIRRLVAAFGLAHPLDTVIPVETRMANLKELAFISIPYRSHHRQQSTITILGEDQFEEDSRALVNLSFDLPPDADARLLRFIRTFNLEVVDLKSDTFNCVAPEPVIKSDGLRGIKSGSAKVVSPDKIKPVWKLYTSCWSPL